MTFSSSTTNTLQNPGQTTVRPPNQFRLPRAPLPTDINANIGDEWEDYSTSPPNFYKLASLFYNTATWRLMTAGAGNVISFSDLSKTKNASSNNCCLKVLFFSTLIAITCFNHFLSFLILINMLCNGSSGVISIRWFI